MAEAGTLDGKNLLPDIQRPSDASSNQSFEPYRLLGLPLNDSLKSDTLPPMRSRLTRRTLNLIVAPRKMLLHAQLSAGGLTLKARCVYVLTLRHGSEIWRYVGCTGTSNRTGTSTPYARLAKHLAKVGKTQSCIWGHSCLPKEFLDAATVSFAALPLEDEAVVLAERWLRWRLGSRRSLNKQKIPASEPDIASTLRERLTRAFIHKNGKG